MTDNLNPERPLPSPPADYGHPTHYDDGTRVDYDKIAKTRNMNGA
jgi:phage baseplate assembly protein gpV